jgi:hypothetical protein
MPSNKRQAVQRRLDQATNLINTAQEYIAEEAIPYEKVHPDYFAMFCSLVAYLEMGKQFTQELRNKI